MRRTIKWMPVLVLVLGLPLALLACGEGEPSDPPTVDGVASPTTAESVAATPTTAETTESMRALDSTSAEVDREVLIAPYNATGGPV